MGGGGGGGAKSPLMHVALSSSVEFYNLGASLRHISSDKFVSTWNPVLPGSVSVALVAITPNCFISLFHIISTIHLIPFFSTAEWVVKVLKYRRFSFLNILSKI